MGYTVFSGMGFSFTRQQLKKMVKQIDSNNNDEIDIDEFMVMMRRKEKKKGVKQNTSYVDELKEAFNVFDKNGDGEITAQELADTMKALGENLTEDDVKFMMSEVDSDNNGVIDFDEFKKMMQ